MSDTVLSIVIPCYDEEAVLRETNRRLTQLLDKLMTDGMVSPESYLLYVDDGSKDGTWPLIMRFHQDGRMVRGLKLAGNVGHQYALVAGLEQAVTDADAMITIDADLQDDVDVIPEMLKKFDDGADIVYGVRQRRDSDTCFKRVTAQGFYKFMEKMGVKTVYNHADFRLMSRRAVEGLLQYRERNLFLRGIVPKIGYKSDCVYYDRMERLAGESKYTLGKMLGLALDGITSFSTRPLRLMMWLGMAFIVIALGILAYVIIAMCMGRQVAGWASLMISVWFVGGCILVCLSIMSEYVGRIFIESKQRPRYIIEDYLK